MTLIKILGTLLIMIAVATYNEYLQTKQRERNFKNIYRHGMVDTTAVQPVDTLLTIRK